VGCHLVLNEEVRQLVSLLLESLAGVELDARPPEEVDEAIISDLLRSLQDGALATTRE